MILEKNKTIDDYFDISIGQKIIIPNDYAPKMILYIDKKLNLPLVIEVHDDKGFYERYEYRKLELNPIITDEEFTTEYKDYNF
jgi:outer membrane lipoprotein-sorting protein